MRPLDRILPRVTVCKKVGDCYRIKHPCYPESDGHASAQIKECSDGTLLISSYNPAYSKTDILTALGLTWQDLFVQQEPPEPAKNGAKGPFVVATYDYTDEDGEFLFQVVRMSDKGFRQRHKNESGEWIWNLQGVRRVLYRLPHVLAAKAEGRTIWIVEGEKDVQTLERLGRTATCNPGGAGKWDQDFTNALRGATIIQVTDKDDAGYRHCEIIGKAVKGLVKSHKVFETAKDGGKDISDHIAAGKGFNELLRREDLEQKVGLSLTRFDENFTPTIPRFWWNPYFPKGKCILIDGDGGTRKTFWASAICAALSQGLTPSTGEPLEKKLRILYLHKGEDQSEEIYTVYQANGGDMDKIVFLHYNDKERTPLYFDDAGCADLRDTINKEDIDVVVVDSLFYFLPPECNTNRTNEVLPFVSRLNDVASETDTLILDLRHTRKSGGLNAGAASDAGLGSVQFRNSHRGQLLFRHHPDEPGVICVHDEKGSLHIAKGKPMAFRTEGLELQFLSEWDDPFAGAGKSKKAQEEKKREANILNACIGWYRSALQGKRTWDSKPIEDQGVILGFSIATQLRARKELGITSTKKGGDGQTWRLVVPLNAPWWIQDMFAPRED